VVKTFTPSTLEEALNILSEKKSTTILAGGTDLMVKNKCWSGTVPMLGNSILLLDNII